MVQFVHVMRSQGLFSTRRLYWFVVVCLLGAACVESPAPKPEDAVGFDGCSSCNLLLISIDTLRADHLSLYGYERPTSPELEKLAQESVVFEQFHHSGGTTLPSHMSMMTSLRPPVHQVSRDRALPEQRTTLAEILQAHGHRTAAFVDSGYVQAKFGFDQGFEIYDDSGGHFEKILPKAETWLEKHHAEPFFLFLHTYDVHSKTDRQAYECPGEHRNLFSGPPPEGLDGCREGRCATRLLFWVNNQIEDEGLDPYEIFNPAEIDFMEARYDGCIHYVDARIREILDTLRRLGIYDETLVVVTSDHGEEFLEHGMLLHRQDAYEHMTHIPLILKMPESFRGGTRSSHLAAMIDLMPTILDILKAPSAPAEAQGLSLLPVILNDQPVRTEMRINFSLRSPQWKYMAHRDMLFDLFQDPAEQNNLYAEQPDRATELHRILRRYRHRDRQLAETLRSEEKNLEVELQEQDIEQLRALGYLE